MQTVESVPYVCAVVDPVPSSRTSVATGPEPTVCIGMPQFPSPVALPRSPSSSDSQPEVEDEYCDILAHDLVGLIEYSYHQGIPSFPEAHLQRTMGLSVLGSEQFQDG
jgi:hypothetical protein